MTSEVMVFGTASLQKKGMKKLLPLLVLVPFTLLSVELAIKGGLAGAAVFREPWALQVALDLVISCFFAGMWIRRDARRHGISALPFLIALPFFGSIAALAYVVRRNFAQRGVQSSFERASSSALS
jgi:hypothetical protein